MRIKKLIGVDSEEKLYEKFPWLKLCNFENAVIDVTNSWIVWHGGIWHGGIWCGGKWCGGLWCGGKWCDGVWRGGKWLGGIWCGGVWHGGIWRGGIWRDGIWRGGEWRDGLWRDGEWRDGLWRDGEWRDGFNTIRCKWYVSWSKETKQIKIGCKEKKVDDWDKWFASGEEYETKRGTNEFDMIENAYKIAKYALELEDGLV